MVQHDGDKLARDGSVASSDELGSTRVNKGVPWTEAEHRAFLKGLQSLGKGNWRGISRNFVRTRTPTQVASHAQKFYLRASSGTKRRSRFSDSIQQTAAIVASKPPSSSASPSSSGSGANMAPRTPQPPPAAAPMMMNPAAAHMLFAYPAGAMHPQFAMHPMFLTPAVAAALMRQGMVMTAVQAPIMPEAMPDIKPEQQLQQQQQQPILAAFDPHLAALHHQASDAAAALMSLSAHRPPTSADALASLCKPSARRTSSGSEHTFKLLSGLTDSGDHAAHATPFPCSLVLKTSASSAFKPASGASLRV